MVRVCSNTMCSLGFDQLCLFFEMEKDDEGWTHIDFDREIELGERIGGGAVGIIYKGWFRDSPVALKTLFDPRVDDKLKREYMDELLVMSKLNHSNIVSFLGACMVSPNLCFVMELCQNSLHHFLHHERVAYSELDCVQISLDIASAMEYLHAQRPAIIHRDLKSLNVLIAFNGAAKISDFGLVKNPNTQAGTPAYMAPELFQNKSFSKTVDAYAFAILMWELFSGDVPFYMMEIMDIRQKVIEGGRPRIPASIPSRISSLIRRCWSVFFFAPFLTFCC
jgi:serine/threonine protein kinase